MSPSWFIAKNTEPTISAIERVLLTLRRTTPRASRQVCQESVRGFIDVFLSGDVDERTEARPEVLPYTYAIPLHAEFRRPADQLDLGVDAELDVDGRQVAVHRALAQEQAFGDLGGRLAAHRQDRNLSLAPAQRGDPGVGASSWSALAAGQEDL